MKNKYTTELKLNHNEIPAKIDLDTGEVTPIKQKSNNIPEGKSKLDYKNFGIINNDMIKVLERECSNLELAVILKLISRINFNTNSLRPLNNDTTVRILADEFNIGINSVTKLFKNLEHIGVYAQFKISEVGKSGISSNEYWILNPYIVWRGRLKNDVIFNYFINTKIVRLL